jgi:hypothetical protein
MSPAAAWIGVARLNVTVPLAGIELGIVSMSVPTTV